jgi:hypothetical protein
LPLRRHKETRLGRSKSAIVENQQSICSQKDNDVGVISIQNSRGPQAEVADAEMSSPAFDRDLAAKIGTRVAMRRSLRQPK